jgi:uroporphyrin-III C-methyltransferase/precorrin-2 dehydrogenase/sirohydrochlorin ferrochelatase
VDLLPLFFKVKQKTALLVGNGVSATRKCELLLRSGMAVYALDFETDLEHELFAHALKAGQLTLLDKAVNLNAVEARIWSKLFVCVAASETDADNMELVRLAKHHDVPCNVLSREDLSDFLFPAIIDRSPIIAAVSSGGELPIISRLLRSKIETTLPHKYGRLAQISSSLKANVSERINNSNARRRFWESQLEGRFADLVFTGDESAAQKVFLEALDKQSSKASFSGEVYLVGAGPGDPDLLTFKALRLMRQADVVLYDRLISPQILSLVRQDAELINVGKERSKHTLPQESINELLAKLAKQGRRVLRLKGGDPFIFGRGGEEIETLAQHGVPFQVVPGITAAAGCGAYAGIPLTHRDYSQSVRFITGHLKTDSAELPWQDFVQNNQTLVFYMGLMGLERIAKALMEHGMSKEMPVALVSKGTTRDQKVVTGNLETIYAVCRASEIKAPTIIIVGEVVKLRDKLAWDQ